MCQCTAFRTQGLKQCFLHGLQRRKLTEGVCIYVARLLLQRAGSCVSQVLDAVDIQQPSSFALHLVLGAQQPSSANVQSMSMFFCRCGLPACSLCRQNSVLRLFLYSLPTFWQGGRVWFYPPFSVVL